MTSLEGPAFAGGSFLSLSEGHNTDTQRRSKTGASSASFSEVSFHFRCFVPHEPVESLAMGLLMGIDLITEILEGFGEIGAF